MLKKLKSILSANKLVCVLGFFYLGVFFLAVCTGSFTQAERIPHLEDNNQASFLDIFLNNIQVSMAILGIGSITGGLMSAVILFYNGYIIGKLVQFLFSNDQAGALWTGLMPHALLEILGLTLFAIVSSFPFISIYQFLIGRTIDVKQLILTNIRFILIGILLLFVASLIEDYISYV
ncbi:stage II sporulation protein M, partial [Paenibacillus larvae]